MDALGRVLGTIREKARELREQFGDEARARSLEWAAEQVEHALSGEADALLRLDEAAHLSGYSRDHLARLIREGRIPNAGRPRAPRIRRADLPRKAAGVAAVPDVSHFIGASAVQVARSLVQGDRR